MQVSGSSLIVYILLSGSNGSNVGNELNIISIDSNGYGWMLNYSF